MKGFIKKILNKLGVHNREELKKLIIQFVKFGLVGASNTLVSWACYYLILWIDEDLYVVGSVVGAIVSIANAFFWNDRFVFKGAEKDWKSRLKRLGKTYVTYGGTSLLSILFIWVEVDILGISKVLAPIVSLIITVPLNFVINKIWTFKNGSKK